MKPSVCASTSSVPAVETVPGPRRLQTTSQNRRLTGRGFRSPATCLRPSSSVRTKLRPSPSVHTPRKQLSLWQPSPVFRRAPWFPILLRIQLLPPPCRVQRPRNRRRCRVQPRQSLPPPWLPRQLASQQARVRLYRASQGRPGRISVLPAWAAPISADLVNVPRLPLRLHRGASCLNPVRNLGLWWPRRLQRRPLPRSHRQVRWLPGLLWQG